MHIDVRYFADAREAAGREAERLELPEGACVRDVVTSALARHPRLEPVVPYCRLALDERFAEHDDAVHEGATVAFLPPVGGG